MPLPGHAMDCDCGCCDVEEESQIKAQTKSVCPSCGKEMPETAKKAGAAAQCPICGANLQPGA
jgi:hypothetical protein